MVVAGNGGTNRENVVEAFYHDVRFCVRCLKKHPGLVALVLLTITLGTGAAVGIYSVVHAVLIRPLPFHEPERLVHIWSAHRGLAKAPLSPPNVADMTRELTLFEGLGARFPQMDVTLTGGDQPVHLQGQFITWNLFDLLGLRPALGRTFAPEDAVPPAEPAEGDTASVTPPALIISHGLWQRNFGGDPDVVGSTIHMNGWPCELVGVMPEGFQIFRETSWGRPEESDVWSPIRWDMSEGDRFFRNLRVVGRLKPGVTLAQAQAELDAFYTRLRERYARFEEVGLRGSVRGMQDDVVEHVRPSLVMVFGGVMFLLLLACANVASLLLVRARGLAAEMAVRAALGCGRGRLVRQVLLESLLLSVSGSVLGLVLGYLGIRLFLDLQPPSTLRLEAVALNLPVLAFALGLAVVVGLAFGSLPALRAGRIDLIGSLKSQVAGAGGGRRRGTLMALVVAEVALSLILLLGAALMTRSVMEVQRSSPGFDRRGTLTVAVNLYGERYFPQGASIELFRELEHRISALPGVQAVGTISILPLSGRRYYSGWGLGTEDDPQWTGVSAHNRVVSGNLFQALGTRLLAGRPFTEAELSEEGSTVMVGEGLARISWPGEDPIGREIVVRWGNGARLLQVVGVVEDVRFQDVRSDEAPAMYFPMGSRPSWAQSVVVRTSSDPGMLAGPIREIIRDLDPGLAPHSIRTMEDLVSRSLASSRFVLALMVLFAGIAIVLASVGLYGVVSYILKQRTPEIGIRMAFGAGHSRIVRMMVGQGAALAVGGIAAGVLGAVAVSRFARSLLYGVTAIDVETFATVSVGLAIVAIMACYMAARRATHIDPVEALRAE